MYLMLYYPLRHLLLKILFYSGSTVLMGVVPNCFHPSNLTRQVFILVKLLFSNLQHPFFKVKQLDRFLKLIHRSVRKPYLPVSGHRSLSKEIMNNLECKSWYFFHINREIQHIHSLVLVILW